MPLVQRIFFCSRAVAVALAASLAALAAPCQAHGNALPDAIGEAAFAVASASSASPTPHASTASGMAVDPRFVIGWYVAHMTQAQALEARASATVMDSVALADATVVDDHALAHQRGTGPGLMTVATPILHGAHSVTLWDEIAPPAPVPVPADAAQVAQSNAVSYFRK
ncbi:MAG TPA: hypothetical protein VF446_01060 [Trinickia sp.]